MAAEGETIVVVRLYHAGSGKRVSIPRDRKHYAAMQRDLLAFVESAEIGDDLLVDIVEIPTSEYEHMQEFRDWKSS
jgi:hypothetical protein